MAIATCHIATALNIGVFLISDFAFMRCCRGDFGDVTAAGAAALSAA